MARSSGRDADRLRTRPRHASRAWGEIDGTKPSTPTKGATIKPKDGAGAAPAEEGGCAVTTHGSRSDAGSAFLLVAAGALLVRRRRRLA